MTTADLNKLVAYWFDGSDYDWQTATMLFKGRRFPYALFMAHLSIEKSLKGIIVKTTREHAPFTHNLVYLAGKLSIELSKAQIALLTEMNEFNLEARYPDDRMEFYRKATAPFAKRYLDDARRFKEWLKKRS